MSTLKIKRENGKIFCPLADSWHIETPEEKVRQEYIKILVEDYGYSLDQMAQEIKVNNSQRGQGKARADIVIWKSKQDKIESKAAFIVVECKAENVRIREEDYYQGYNYASWAGASFFVTTNEKETKYFNVDKDYLPKELVEVVAIPTAEEALNDKKVKDILSKSFELKRIGKAITRRKDQMVVEDDKRYKRITIKTNCGGVFVRDEVLGKDIKTKKQYYVKAGQLAVSKIDARNGAFGIVPPEADGAIITGNFWVYDVNPEIANIDYLILLLSSNVFVQAWQDCSNGSGNRLYLQEDRFLNYKIPMPAVIKQKQIVDRYNKGICDANSATNKAYELSNSIDLCLFNLLHIKPIAEQDRSTQGLISTTTLKDLIGWGAKINSNPIKPQELFKSTAYKNMPLEFYCEINPKTIYPDDIEDVSFIPMECVSDIYGEIIKHKNGKSTNSKGYTSFQENDVIWAKITPCMQNGKCAVATNLKNGYGYGSTEFHVFRATQNAIPEYIHCFMRSKRVREVAMSYFTGSAGQQRIGTDFLEALTLPLLPLRSEDPNVTTQETVVKKVIEIRTQIKELHIKATNICEQAKKEFEEAVFGETQKITN